VKNDRRRLPQSNPRTRRVMMLRMKALKINPKFLRKKRFRIKRVRVEN
jgi:hypothetical protein